MNDYPNPYANLHFSPLQIGFGVIISVICIIGMWKVFTKAGKPGWASLIPIYNTIVLLQIVGKPWWWLLFLFIPCANIIFAIIGLIWVNNLLSKSFGKDVGFTVGLILLSPIFICILGFGDAVYLGPGGAPVVFGANDYQQPFNNTPEA